MIPEPPSLLAEVTSDLIENRLRDGASVRFRVATCSMVPTLQPGDEIIVKAEAIQRVPVGSLVVLRQQNYWVIHRLIHRRREADGVWQMMTKGDHSLFADPLWRGEDWVGVAQAAQRDSQWKDFTTFKARWLGGWIAALSWLEAHLSLQTRRGFGRLARRVLRRMVVGLAELAYEL